MEPTTSSNRLHPLVAAAAVSVMLVSLIGVAAITGILPNSQSTTAPLGASTSQEGDMDAPTKADTAKLTAPVQPKSMQQAITPPIAQAKPICHQCGRIESIHTIQQAARPSGIGVAAGAVLGGLLGNQVGGGNGRTLATVAGAVGGGYAGNEVERRTSTTSSYQVRVRMEDGSIRNMPQSGQNGWQIGDRVRIVNGSMRSDA